MTVAVFLRDIGKGVIFRKAFFRMITRIFGGHGMNTLCKKTSYVSITFHQLLPIVALCDHLDTEVLYSQNTHIFTMKKQTMRLTYFLHPPPPPPVSPLSSSSLRYFSLFILTKLFLHVFFLNKHCKRKPALNNTSITIEISYLWQTCSQQGLTFMFLLSTFI